MVTRRQFLKAGVIGSAALGVLAVFYVARQPKSAVGRLGPRERVIVAAVASAILAGALPEAGEARRQAVTHAVDGAGIAIAGLSATAQSEVGELFALLGVAPARILVAGVWSDWDEADPASVAAFLERWRNSRFALLRSAYAALHDLVIGAWYGDEATWAAIGYPGPPEL